MRRNAALVVLLGAFAPPLASAAVLRVPSVYPTVQAGLAAAGFGDSVLVAPGTYSNCDESPCTPSAALAKEGVALVSEGGPDMTVLRVDTAAGGLAVVQGVGVGSGGFLLKGFAVTSTALGYRGAVFLSSSNIVVEDCHFVDLSGGLQAGGGVLTNVAGITLRDCSFRDCEAALEGGGLRALDGPCVLERCRFSRCMNGGAIIVGHASLSATVRDCVFENNTGNTALTIIQMPQSEVTGNVFVGNSSVINAAALTIGFAGTAVVRDNVFWANDGSRSVGVFSWRSNGPIEGNTFFGNVAPPSGGVVVDFSDGALGTFATASRNILAGSSGGPAYRAEFAVPFGGCNLFWSNAAGDFAGLYSPFPTDVFADPLFCDAVGGDLTLHESSPCLPANSGTCGQIGALGGGCGTIGVEPESWAKLKALYRGGGAR